MGIVGSKDDRGVRVLQPLPTGVLDEKGKELRNQLDICLEKNGWFFTIAGLALTVPICFKFKTERPFYVAAILCPVADMYFSTLQCVKENDAFIAHYKWLQERYSTPIYKQQQQLEGEDGDWRPQPTQQPTGSATMQRQQQHSDQQEQQQGRGWWWRR